MYQMRIKKKNLQIAKQVAIRSFIKKGKVTCLGFDFFLNTHPWFSFLYYHHRSFVILLLEDSQYRTHHQVAHFFFKCLPKAWQNNF